MPVVRDKHDVVAHGISPLCSTLCAIWGIAAGAGAAIAAGIANALPLAAEVSILSPLRLSRDMYGGWYLQVESCLACSEAEQCIPARRQRVVHGAGMAFATTQYKSCHHPTGMADSSLRAAAGAAATT